MRLRRVAVRVRGGEEEAARARLLELFPDGLEEIEGPDLLELAVYTDGVGEAAVREWFTDASSVAVEPGWEDRWKEHHRAIRAGGLWIGPPWEDVPVGEPSVVVDPGRAFGTGAHPTTRACIGLLSSLECGSLLDAGCGSGVLAVAAVRLGFEPVHAVDLDPVAVDVARATARSNRVHVDVFRADVVTDELPGVDVVAANIELRVVERLLGRLRAGIVVTSGYPAGVEPSAQGWDVLSRAELDGWGAHVFGAA